MVITVDGTCYEVIAKYIEVDGEPNVLELLRHLKTE